MKVNRFFACVIMVSFASTSLAATGLDTDSLAQKKDTVRWYNKVHDLGEISVVAHTPIVKMKTDKMSYQVKNDPDSKSHTVLEMLRKVPMVTVDGKNNISVNGSKEFKVYVDGRLSTTITRNPTQVLRNMPANSVLTIEIITNPGAQYDAEGVGGILNIITKKKKNLKAENSEFNGTVHSTIGTQHWGMDVSLNGQQNRLSYDLNLMGDYLLYRHTPESTSLLQKGNDPSSMQTSLNAHQQIPFYMGELALGYQLDSISSMHMSLSTTQFGMKETGTPSYLYSGGIYGKALSFSNHMLNKSKERSYDLSLDYQRFFGRGKLSSMMFTYQFSNNPTRNDIRRDYFDLPSAYQSVISSLSSHVVAKHINHNFLTDFSFKLGENNKLNTGTKYSMERNRSNAEDITYLQKQNILALYAEWESKMGWFSIKPGLRYEYTWQNTLYEKNTGENFKLSYGQLVPALSATAKISESQNIGINYNLRIRRPGIEELNPYVNRQDPTSIFYGNIHLDIEKTQNMALVYTLTGSKFSMSATLGHSMSNNAIEQYSFYQKGILNTTYGNVMKNHITSLNLYANWSVTPSTRMLLNTQTTYADMRSKQLEAHNSGWSSSINYGIQQTLPWQLKLTTNLELMTRDYTIQGWESGMAQLSASLSKSFCHDKWNISLSGTTGLSHGGKLIWKQYSEGKNFISTMSFSEPVQALSLGISYSFGGKNNKNDDFDVSLHAKKKRNEKR